MYDLLEILFILSLHLLSIQINEFKNVRVCEIIVVIFGFANLSDPSQFVTNIICHLSAIKT